MAYCIIIVIRFIFIIGSFIVIRDWTGLRCWSYLDLDVRVCRDGDTIESVVGWRTDVLVVWNRSWGLDVQCLGKQKKARDTLSVNFQFG